MLCKNLVLNEFKVETDTCSCMYIIVISETDTCSCVYIIVISETDTCSCMCIIVMCFVLFVIPKISICIFEIFWKNVRTILHIPR